MSETLRPETAPQTHYVVTVEMVETRDTHVQEWKQCGADERDGYGYVTECKPRKIERRIFTAEVAARPNFAALIAALEPTGGGRT